MPYSLTALPFFEKAYTNDMIPLFACFVKYFGIAKTPYSRTAKHTHYQRKGGVCYNDQIIFG